jgi:hypothetical protein
MEESYEESCWEIHLSRQGRLPTKNDSSSPSVRCNIDRQKVIIVRLTKGHD